MDRGPPELEVCFVIDKHFGYLDTINVDIKGGMGQSNRVIKLNIKYDLWWPFCRNCQGFGHWSLVCREWRGTSNLRHG